MPQVRYAVLRKPPLEVVEEEVPGAEVSVTTAALHWRSAGKGPSITMLTEPQSSQRNSGKSVRVAIASPPANSVKIQGGRSKRSPSLKGDMPLSGSSTDPPFAALEGLSAPSSFPRTSSTIGVMLKRKRRRSMIGNKRSTSAVLPGHISVQTGAPLGVVHHP